MRKIIIALIASTGVLSGCSDFLGTDPDNRTYIDTPEKVSALLVSAYPSSTFYSVVDARCDGFVDYGTAIAGVAAFATESVIENVANNVSISFEGEDPADTPVMLAGIVGQMSGTTLGGQSAEAGCTNNGDITSGARLGIDNAPHNAPFVYVRVKVIPSAISPSMFGV